MKFIKGCQLVKLKSYHNDLRIKLLKLSFQCCCVLLLNQGILKNSYAQTIPVIQNKIDVPEWIYDQFNKLGLQKDDIDSIYRQMIQNLKMVQYNISDIAQKSIPYDKRQKIIEETLKYFESPKSVVEVSNPFRVVRRQIYVYLDRLLDLRYHKVTVAFAPELQFSDVSSNKDNEHEVGISVWQHFRARNKEGNISYEDNTQKKMFFTITQNDQGWDVKINRIMVIETEVAVPKPFDETE